MEAQLACLHSVKQCTRPRVTQRRDSSARMVISTPVCCLPATPYPGTLRASCNTLRLARLSASQVSPRRAAQQRWHFSWSTRSPRAAAWLTTSCRPSTHDLRLHEHPILAVLTTSLTSAVSSRLHAWRRQFDECETELALVAGRGDRGRDAGQPPRSRFARCCLRVSRRAHPSGTLFPRHGCSNWRGVLLREE